MNSNFKTKITPTVKLDKGLNEETVRSISRLKNEPSWMLEFRLKALALFNAKKMPAWGPDLSAINFDDLYYYIRSQDEQKKSWAEVPAEIKNTFERLGIPQAEREYLSGVEAQFESEVVYGSLKKELEEKGVIFSDTDSALQKYPEIFQKYFAKAVPPADNKFSALNSAVWSGGSFIYVPPNVRVAMPLQAYFRINERNMGQFERTLIIADCGSYINYVEGCTAPVYSATSLHAAVVEIFVEEGARVRYTTIQNWSGDVYNLVTKRSFVAKNGVMEWVDCNLGSKVTMKYPSIYLKGEGARGETLSLAYAKAGQNQDVGGKIFHLASDTSSRIVSKSVSAGSGVSTYRGLVKISSGVKDVKTNVICNALLLGKNSVANTYPFIEIASRDVSAGHEATVSKVDEEQLYYLMTRGLSKDQAQGLIVSGFIEPIAKELPMEYAVELNRLLEIDMKGSVG
ncbi:Fe-S cluster assembly protein SufB [candidate division WWE3 bacterium CG08_land_8_20_14_0_20_40_13]|uniref:Fe-S cluster assembly protein SufB n=1 Tax=candidate division WWE3 bacterium CG08_land_8_20_14_0_20_40_13 TaxID=1975084 RepID=A0A2H0XDS8_UNCKA|nr:MAG: Fe-S cluster assembly protein SufB [candidate division WWE3 bacterium CG08_land_8_20_14_0_20_40_13]